MATEGKERSLRGRINIAGKEGKRRSVLKKQRLDFEHGVETL